MNFIGMLISPFTYGKYPPSDISPLLQPQIHVDPFNHQSIKFNAQSSIPLNQQQQIDAQHPQNLLTAEKFFGNQANQTNLFPPPIFQLQNFAQNSQSQHATQIPNFNNTCRNNLNNPPFISQHHSHHSERTQTHGERPQTPQNRPKLQNVSTINNNGHPYNCHFGSPPRQNYEIYSQTRSAKKGDKDFNLIHYDKSFVSTYEISPINFKSQLQMEYNHSSFPNVPDRTKISFQYGRDLANQFFYNHLSKNQYNLTNKCSEKSKMLESSRNAIYERLKRVVKQSFKGLNVNLMSYGSWNTGQLIPSSDIDQCIQGFDSIDRKNVIKILETIDNNLRLFKWITEIKSIYTASIPVLKIEACAGIPFESFHSDVGNIEKLTEKFLGNFNESNINLLNPEISKEYKEINIKVDVSVETFDDFTSRGVNVGLRTTKYIEQALSFQPNIQYNIVLVLKQWLNELGYLNAYKGGQSSYGLCLLVIAYLDFFKSNLKKACVGELFMKFLEFYGCEFNPIK